MKKKEIYKFPLRVKKQSEKPMKKIAESNGRSLNNEINVAIEGHIELHKDKIK